MDNVRRIVVATLDFPYTRALRAVEHLAGYRGCTVGVFAAEAFEVGHIID